MSTAKRTDFASRMRQQAARRRSQSFGSAPAPPKPGKPPKPPKPTPKPPKPRTEPGPKPKTSRPQPQPVPQPQRLVRRGKQWLNGKMIANERWGSPFRTLERDGQWWCVWAGEAVGKADHRPADWQDIACKDRLEAAKSALAAYEDWLVQPRQANLRMQIRSKLKGFNLVCACRQDYPCHGTVLVRVANIDGE